ncbi:MAG: (d)CMP kinase [Smithellaceae bacterium]|nr:(d)CMP kinase [Smithellaceae bacterium]
MRERRIITIDGPSGAGKSTVSKAVARALSYLYLDTGALYRAAAYKVIISGTRADDGQAIAAMLGNTVIEIDAGTGGIHVRVDGRDVTGEIRSESVGMLASAISALPEVREALKGIQRAYGRNGGVVAEGRDMGTVIFPDADFKFFLDADEEERIKRRHLELAARGENTDPETVKENLIRRDKQDAERKTAPLKVAEDAIIIDSTRLSIDEVVTKILGHITSK